ncbi:VWA domain-containing protein [Roseomonas gilardii]|uniref:VWA domain-containing protein n=1 Tax=Roseomonas gilardii TaxID=257708 RepID=A0ABU3MIT9_9PROT|nr:VWA domain-containing protein [Roseomonas gilardii]MDT8332931.1 VWA domain-containing protein [Roseomonas gilardii]
MRDALANLHLLRPGWLLLLLPAAAAWWLDRTRLREAGGWSGVVSPSLLPWLLVTEGRAPRLRPGRCAAVLLAIAALALSGPSWRREPSPFVADQAPMMVALDVSRAGEPRLDAARRKIRDLVEARGGARTGLLAYAGGAYLVLPPTGDPKLLETYLDALSPRIMPRDGRDAPAALAEALRQLDRQDGAGTVLLVTDSIPAAQGEAFDHARAGTRHAVVVLPPGVTAPEALDGARGATWIAPTPDTADIQAVMGAAQRHFAAASSDDPTLRWQDAGYAVLLLLVPLALLWSRRGFLALPLLLALSGLASAQEPVRATAAPATVPAAPDGGMAARLRDRFVSLWLTPDQRGRLAFGRGDFATAAALFTDPLWRGVALYRAGDFAGTVAALAASDTALGWYDRGNAEMLQPFAWDRALAAYDRALALRPAFPEAKANRALAAAFVAYQRALDEERARQSSDRMNEKPDDTIVDPNAPRPPPRPPSDQPAQPQEGLSDADITAMWMRRVGGSPADFLRSRFARQAEGPKP